jgi:hypothetical protein
MVEDARGARFHIHEFKFRRLLLWRSRFELDSGEQADRIDERTFSVLGTGERLKLVDLSQTDGPA